VSKKIRDPRQDPPAPEEVSTNYRVDRVYGSARPRPKTIDPSQVASDLLARRATKTTPPVVGGTGEDTELSLRRQLSRLQRQLAEAQRELANKDDELAAEAEKRLQITEAHDAALAELKDSQLRLGELTAYEARTRGIEQRLQESLETGDELGEVLDAERRKAAALEQNLDELARSFEETRTLWASEKKALEERTAADLAALEAQRKAAVAAGEEALAQSTQRMTDAHEAEIAQLREAHERSVSTLRGELEPKVIEARTLAEDRERLASEVEALKAEAVRQAIEHGEELGRLRSQLTEKHAAELSAQARAAATELATATGERDKQILELQQSGRAAESRAQTAEDEVALLREGLKKIQREASDATERATRLEADNKSLEERLTLATATAEKLVETQRDLREQLEAQERETRRAAMDRMRFVAYLEEGLALLGALPPAAEQPEPPSIETEGGEEA
jgi:chromosome segregation ATPase